MLRQATHRILQRQNCLPVPSFPTTKLVGPNHSYEATYGVKRSALLKLRQQFSVALRPQRTYELSDMGGANSSELWRWQRMMRGLMSSDVGLTYLGQDASSLKFALLNYN